MHLQTCTTSIPSLYCLVGSYMIPKTTSYKHQTEQKHWLFPRKLQHTPAAHPRQFPYPTMKGFPLQPVGKGLGVCSKGVLKQPKSIPFKQPKLRDPTQELKSHAIWESSLSTFWTKNDNGCKCTASWWWWEQWWWEQIENTIRGCHEILVAWKFFL